MLQLITRLLALVIPLVAANAQDVSNLFTQNGYDNIGGVDSMCWFAPVFSLDEVADQIYYRPDIAISTSLVTGPVEFMDSCPAGTSVHVEPPIELKQGEILRTGQPYSFEISGSIDLQTLRTSMNLSDTALLSSIAGRLVFCPPNGILCSPFVIDQAHAILDHIHADEEIATNSSDHDAREAYYDLVDLSLLMIVNHSSPWQFQPVVQGATNININMTVDLSFTDPGHYLPLGTFERCDSIDIVVNTLHLLIVSISISFNLTKKGVIQFLVQDADQNSTALRSLKIDVANIVQSSQLDVQEPPYISSVSTSIQIVAWIVIGMGALVQLVLIFFSVRYRNESVMRMAQGNFLIVMQVAALFATACSFLFNPISDMACLLVGPLTLIPMQLVLAILYGRLLRIVTLMGSLMSWNQPTSNNDVRKSLKRLSRSFQHMRSRSDASNSSTSSVESSNEPQRQQPHRRLRKNFPAKWLIPLIVAVTFPQVLVQVIVSVFFPRELEVGLNSDETAGRYECGYNQIHMLDVPGPLILFITMLITLLEAYKARELPALFSETSYVSAALMTIVGVTLLAVVVVASTHIEMGSPDLQYLMQVLIVVNFALNLSVRVLVPKFRLIWNGEKIVVSQVMADHVRQRNSQISNRSHVSNLSQVSNRSHVSNASQISNRSQLEGSSKLELSGSLVDVETNNNKGEPDVPTPVFNSIYLESECFNDERDGTHSQPLNCDPERMGPKDVNDELAVEPSQPLIHNSHSKESGNAGGPYTDYIVSMGMDAPDEKPTKSREHIVAQNSKSAMESKKSDTIRLQSGCAPPRELTVTVVQLHRQVAKVNDRILSGLVVSEEDWISLRKNVSETQRLLRHMSYHE